MHGHVNRSVYSIAVAVAIELVIVWENVVTLEVHGVQIHHTIFVVVRGISLRLGDALAAVHLHENIFVAVAASPLVERIF